MYCPALAVTVWFCTHSCRHVHKPHHRRLSPISVANGSGVAGDPTISLTGIVPVANVEQGGLLPYQLINHVRQRGRWLHNLTSSI
ncbi:MAG: hypothetical protein IPI29_00020 [Ignavibacteria bacterium]|nr:hypothetical protein [Ignavibacteria bacterium]